jgi:hypothetical protein
MMMHGLANVKVHKLLLEAFRQHSLPVLALLVPFAVQDVTLYYLLRSRSGVSCQSSFYGL